MQLALPDIGDLLVLITLVFTVLILLYETLASRRDGQREKRALDAIEEEYRVVLWLWPVVRNLLLLLLALGFVGLLIGSQKLRPLFVLREFLIDRQNRFRWRHSDANLHLALGRAFQRTDGWWNIGIITADRGSNVPLPANQIIGRIKTDPAKARQQRFHPGMRGAIGGAIFMGFVVMQIAAHIAARNAQAAHQSNHDVSEILADAFAIFEGHIDRRIDASGMLSVFESSYRSRFSECKTVSGSRPLRSLTPIFSPVHPKRANVPAKWLGISMSQ